MEYNSHTGYHKLLFKAILTPEAEVHDVNSNASGTVYAELHSTKLNVWGKFKNLESDFDKTVAGGSHIHLGIAGTNGPIAFTLVPELCQEKQCGVFRRECNCFTLDQDQIRALLDGKYYVNIHTKNEPAGELRGQFVSKQFDKVLFTELTVANTNPLVTGSGQGAVLAVLDGNRLEVSGSFSNLSSDVDTSIAGGAHIHFAMPGQNGPVAFILDLDFQGDQRNAVIEPSRNTFRLTSEQIRNFKEGNYYVNVHTVANQSGHIRGQLEPLRSHSHCH